MEGAGDPLTGREFWDEFWAPVELPTSVDEGGLFERAFLPILEGIIDGHPVERALEIGCAPGRWMAMLHKRHGLSVTGIDNSPGGMAMTVQNLRMLDVPATLIESDVFGAQVSERFDLVYSLGVIEHFADPQKIVDRHVELVAPGGLVLIEVPVLTGLTGLALRRTESQLLEHHNIEVMHPAALRDLLRTAGVAPIASGFVGGFEPSFIDLGQAPRVARGGLALVGRIRRRMRFTDRLNRFGLSSFCYAVGRRPAERR